MIGFYDTDWFLNFNAFGVNMRDLFQIQSINLSVAVWVGFIALFGVATDDEDVMREHHLSERMLNTVGANNFMIFEGQE